MSDSTDTLTALLLTPVWFAVLGVAYAVVRYSPLHQARVAQWKAMAVAETVSVSARP